MTESAASLVPLPVVAVLLPSSPRAAAGAAFRPGRVGARAHLMSAGVGLGLGERRRNLAVDSRSGGLSARPPAEYLRMPFMSEPVTDAVVGWTPWQVSDQLAPSYRSRGLPSTLEPPTRQPARQVEPERKRTPAARSTLRPEQPAVRSEPVLLDANTVEFAPTGFEQGTGPDLLSKLGQLNQIQSGGMVGRSEASPKARTSRQPNGQAPPVPPIAPAERHVADAASSSELTSRSGTGVAQRRTSGRPAAGTPTAASPSPATPAASQVAAAETAGADRLGPTAFAAVWTNEPSAIWPGDALIASTAGFTPAASGGPTDTPTRTLSPAVAEALDGLRTSTASRQVSPTPSPTPAPGIVSSTVQPVAEANLRQPAAALVWPGDLAADAPVSPLSDLPHALMARKPASPLRAARSRTKSVTRGREEIGSRAASTLAGPAPIGRAQLDDAGQVEFSPTGHDHGTRDDMLAKFKQLEELRSGRSARDRAQVASLEPASSLTPASSLEPASSLASASLPVGRNRSVLAGALLSPRSGLDNLSVRSAVADIPPGQSTSALDQQLAVSGTAAVGDGSVGDRSTEERFAEAPLAVRFLQRLREQQRVETERLPQAFRPLAHEIGVRRPVMVASGQASRAALAAVDRPAATVGSTIHLAAPLDDSPESHAIVAHELVHAAENSPLPRFFDDPVVTDEERRARQVEQAVRAETDLVVRRTSSARGRSVGGVAPRAPGQSSGSLGAGSAGGTSAAAMIRSISDTSVSSGSATPSVRRSLGSGGAAGGDVIRRSPTGSGGTSRSTSSQRDPRAEAENPGEVGGNDDGANAIDIDGIYEMIETRLVRKLTSELQRRGFSSRGRF